MGRLKMESKEDEVNTGLKCEKCKEKKGVSWTVDMLLCADCFNDTIRDYRKAETGGELNSEVK